MVLTGKRWLKIKRGQNLSQKLFTGSFKIKIWFLKSSICDIYCLNKFNFPKKQICILFADCVSTSVKISML